MEAARPLPHLFPLTKRLKATKPSSSGSGQVAGVVDGCHDRSTVCTLDHGQGAVLDKEGEDAVARAPYHVEDRDLDHATMSHTEYVTVRVALMDAAERPGHPLSERLSTLSSRDHVPGWLAAPPFPELGKLLHQLSSGLALPGAKRNLAQALLGSGVHAHGCCDLGRRLARPRQVAAVETGQLMTSKSLGELTRLVQPSIGQRGVQLALDATRGIPRRLSMSHEE